MSILVTGHLGFIGSHLVRELNSRGLKWVGYDLKDGNDIRDIHALDEFFEKEQVTAVIHLAALAGVRRGETYPQEYISTNVLGTKNIVKMCEKHSIQHLVFYSSSSVYGNQKPPVSEECSKQPVSLYGITKLAGEHIVRSSRLPQKTVIIPFTVYGENGRRDEVVYKWLNQYLNGKQITVYGDGSSKRGYVYVRDLVKTTVDALVNHVGSWEYEEFNLGGSEIIYLKDILNIFKKLAKDASFEYLSMPECDVYENYANTSKAEAILGFKPRPEFRRNVMSIVRDEIKENK